MLPWAPLCSRALPTQPRPGADSAGVWGMGEQQCCPSNGWVSLLQPHQKLYLGATFCCIVHKFLALSDEVMSSHCSYQRISLFDPHPLF